MNIALFLDRDGVLNIDHGYIGDPDRIEIAPGIVDLLRQARGLGFLLIVVTNQSGIARGYFTQTDYEAVERRLCDIFATEGIHFDGIYHCPHHPDGIGDLAIHCTCRKPAPGMIHAAARDLNIDLSLSLLVGDKPTDIAAAAAAGIGRSFLVPPFSSPDGELGNIFREVKGYLGSLS